MSNKARLVRFLRYAHAVLGTALGLFLLFILVNSFLVTTYRVRGRSMDPTLRDGQVLGVDLASYVVAQPQRGDIAIVAYAGNRSVRFVKRVQGIPGDSVEVRGQPVVLKAGEYFVVGDNLDHSTDSRSYGPVLRSQLVGKVFWR